MARIALFLLPALAVLAACGAATTAGGGGPGSGGGGAAFLAEARAIPPSWGTGEGLTEEYPRDQLGREAFIVARPNLTMGMTRIRGKRWPVSYEWTPPLDPRNGLPPLPEEPPEGAPDIIPFAYAMTCEDDRVQCERGRLQSPAPTSQDGRDVGAVGVAEDYRRADAQWASQSRRNWIVFRDPDSGIHIMESLDWKSAPRTSDPATRGWGAWLNHSGFAVLASWAGEPPLQQGETWGFGAAWVRAQFAGDAAGSRPTLTDGATWTGVMTGVHLGDRRGDDWTPLTGQANLTWHPGSNEIGAAFTGLESLVSGKPWGDEVRFSRIPVDEQGRFASGVPGASGNYIQGGFFGARHDEAAGMFEQSGIIGAFGARREAPETEETADPEPETIVLGDVLIAAQGQLFRTDSMCSGSICTVTFQGERVTVDLREVDPDGPDVTVTGQSTRNSVQTGRATASEDGFDFSTFGVWGDYNVGTPSRGSTTVDGVSIEFALPSSLGTGSGSNPVSGSAVWTGAMAGVKVGGSGLGAEVTGDAVMTVDLTAADLDLAFTNIADTSGARSDDLRWTGVSMRNGSFSGIGGLDGRFYGPNHEEAGGVFERSGIAGAFSLARQ